VEPDEKQSTPWFTPPNVWDALKPAAKANRHAPTFAESLLWQALRRGSQGGVRFRRQHAIGSYIVDFYCSSRHLVIEIDGSVHDMQKAEDAERQAYIESLGFQVLRFKNEEVLSDLDGVLARIGAAI
jgi:very-short-patch-repair endonuclease